jgi:hypothetical protein
MNRPYEEMIDGLTAIAMAVGGYFLLWVIL